MVELVARLVGGSSQEERPVLENGFNTVLQLVNSFAGSLGNDQPGCSCDAPNTPPLVGPSTCQPTPPPLTQAEFAEFVDGIVALIAAYQESALLDMLIKSQLSTMDAYLGSLRYDETQRQINDLRADLDYIYGFAY